MHVFRTLLLAALSGVPSVTHARCQDPEADASTGTPFAGPLVDLRVPEYEPVPPGGFWRPPGPLSARHRADELRGVEGPAKPDAGAAPTFTSSLSIREQITEPLITQPGDGRIWVRTRDFRASFGDDGFVVFPVFGSRSPREWPVHFTLSHATSGGDTLDLATRGAVDVDGRRVELQRAALREVYHLEVDQVEQTFVLDSLPGAGDLILRLDVATDLQPVVDGERLLFVHESFGHVAYGAAFLIDAAGSRQAIERRWDGSGIVFTVPATLLAEASFPITIDPVVSSFASSFGATDDSYPDVCYAGGIGRFFVCWQEYTSATNADIYATSFSPGGAQGTSFAVETTSDYHATPRIAYIPAGDRLLIVSSRTDSGPGTGGNAGIIGHLIDASTTGLVGGSFFISTVGSFKIDPDVGGTNYTASTNNHFLVAWTRINSASTYTMEYRVIDWTGSAVTPVSPVSTASNEKAIQLAISESHGDANLSGDWWTLVWIRDTNDDGLGTVMGRRIVWNGSTTLGGGNFVIDSSNFQRFANPTVTSRLDSILLNTADRPSIVAYEYWPMIVGGGGSHGDIRARMVVDGQAFGSNSISSMEDFDSGLRQFSPSIGTDGDCFILTYAETWYGNPTGADHDLYMVSGHVTARGNDALLALAERHQNIAFTAVAEIHCRLAMVQDGDNQSVSDDGVCIWMRQLGATGGQLRGALLDCNTTDTSSDIAVGVQFCDAQPNSVGQLGNGRTASWLWLRGNHSVGGVHRAHGVELPMNSFGHLACSLQTGNVLFPGGSQGRLCLGGSIGRYSNAIQSSGTSGTIDTNVYPGQMPQPTGFVAALPGQTWYFQYWHRDSIGGVATSNFSNGCGVTFRP